MQVDQTTHARPRQLLWTPDLNSKKSNSGLQICFTQFYATALLVHMVAKKKQVTFFHQRYMSTFHKDLHSLQVAQTVKMGNLFGSVSTPPYSLILRNYHLVLMNCPPRPCLTESVKYVFSSQESIFCSQKSKFSSQESSLFTKKRGEHSTQVNHNLR